MKRLYLISIIATLGLSSCYKFEPILPKGTVSPTLAFPIISVDQNIEESIDLIDGAFEINIDVDSIEDWARYKNIYLSDTIDYALADIYEKAKVVRYIAFRLNVSNDFPATATAQIIFLNALDAEIDALFYPDAFQVISSNFSSTGDVIARGQSNTEIVIDKQRLETLKNATRVVIKCSVSNEGVPIEMFERYKEYYLSIRLNVRIGVDINIDEQ